MGEEWKTGKPQQGDSLKNGREDGEKTGWGEVWKDG